MSTRELVHAAFAAHFPVTGANASLEYVETVETQWPGTLGIVVRLVIWDTASQSIRDVKEQRVAFPYPVDAARLDEFLTGYAVVAARALAWPEVATLMPHELLVFSPLKLVKAHTAADFERALQVKSRLGRYLPTSEAVAR